MTTSSLARRLVPALLIPALVAAAPSALHVRLAGSDPADRATLPAAVP